MKPHGAAYWNLPFVMTRGRTFEYARAAFRNIPTVDQVNKYLCNIACSMNENHEYSCYRVQFVSYEKMQIGYCFMHVFIVINIG